MKDRKELSSMRIENNGRIPKTKGKNNCAVFLFAVFILNFTIPLRKIVLAVVLCEAYFSIHFSDLNTAKKYQMVI